MAFKKLLFALIAGGLTLWAAVVGAQVPSYQLFNDTNTALNFQTLDPARGTWKAQSLGGKEQKTYTMSSGNPVGKIRISTPSRGYNEYKVGAGGIYRLTWNDGKQMWDVATLQKGYSANDNVNPVQPQRNNPAYGGSAYRLGDAVLVEWKQKWYPATVIQVSGDRTRIHYDGYDNSWDEWVGASRIRSR